MARGYRGGRTRKIRILPLRVIPEVTASSARDMRPLGPLDPCLGTRAPGSSLLDPCSMVNSALPSSQSDDRADVRLGGWQVPRQGAALYALSFALVGIAFALRAILA